VVPESALAPEALCAAIEAPTLFIGNGVERYRDLFRKSLRDRFVEPEGPLKYSTAAGVARLAAPRFDTQNNFDLNQLHINYIRKSEAELSLGGSLAERRS